MNRTGPPQRRTELARGGPICRGQPGPRPGALLALVDSAVPAGQLVVATRAPARYTGPPGEVRDLCYARQDGLCGGCGKPVPPGTWRSLQHRVARMAGGRLDPAANEPSNLVWLHGSATSPGCHLLCEQRDERMHERGLWLRSWQDPEREPVVLWDGRTVWLTRDGQALDYDPTDPDRASAA